MLWRALLLLCCIALPLAAQDSPAPPAVLVADDIELTADRVLIARGNVEAFQGETRLSATEIRYDQASGQLKITGPITIDDGGGAIVLADQAALSQDLQNGLLTGARLVLDQQLQLAAVELSRVGGRYTQLYKAAITSCQICEGDTRPPLWQIRAQRVIHDTEEKQLYFDQAHLRIRNIPIFYFPRLRLPDPTLDRATGFLIPTVRSTSRLGLGLKLPYFIRLGDHRDLTLTPYLSPETRTLELRYRQAFVNGRIEFNGALTDDTLQPGDTRGYLFGVGRFELERDFVLGFDLETTTDDAYLKEYGFSDADRLVSTVELSRVKRDEYLAFTFTNFRSLRDGEDNSTLPANVFDIIWERRFHPRRIGGELRLSLDAHTHVRSSTLDVDGPDNDLIVDGRDVARLSVDASWRRTWFLGGLESQVMFGLAADTFSISQDSTFPDGDSRITPSAALTLRYPLVRHGARATQVIEPMLQVAWSGDAALNVPNEESTRVEFDEGNLLTLSRFPAPDRRETGLRSAVGISWARYAADSWDARLTLGQIFRDESIDDFTHSSGLSGVSSDLLVAGQLKLQNGLSITARALLDAELEFSKTELRSDWSNNRINVGGSYVWLDEDLEEDRPSPVSELSLDGGMKLSPEWLASANVRYDFETGRAITTGLGFTYSNECVRVGFTVDRSFTSSSSVEPQTSLGLTVSLQGFSTRPGTEKYMRACGKNAS